MTIRIAPSVASLESDWNNACSRAGAGDHIEVVGMPVPGLEPLDHTGEVWLYVAPVGTMQAATDESHRLALIHPEYDGFLTLEILARTDLSNVRVEPDAALLAAVTPQHAIGALRRGQIRPIDLELHPGAIGPRGVSGLLRVVDDVGVDIAAPVRMTLATDASLDCVLAGHADGPWDDPQALDSAVAELMTGRCAPRRMARRIERMLDGDIDPGAPKRPWRRR